MNILSATIFLTDKCNLACSYCYEPTKEHVTISKEQIKKFIHLLYENDCYRGREKIQMDFIGGEPLLEPELIEYALETFMDEGEKRKHPWVRKGHHSFFFTTNGTLFKVPKVKQLLDKFPNLICGLSLDGCKDAHDINRTYLDGRGSYDEILETFDYWKKRYKQPNVKGTLARNTLPFLCDMLCNQVKIGMVQPWANPVFEENWTAVDAQEYKRQLERFVNWLFTEDLALTTSVRGFTKRQPQKNEAGENAWCGTGRYMVSLGLDGYIYPCHRFSTNTYKVAIGHIDRGIDKSALESLLDNFSKFRCVGCNLNGFCPTCFASFYDINKGDYKPVSHLCEMVKVEMGILNYYHQKLLEDSEKYVKWGDLNALCL